MSFNFGEKTWPEIQEYVEKDALIILPVGEIEEHSLYLPVDTDARIASFLAYHMVRLYSQQGMPLARMHTATDSCFYQHGS